MKKKLIVAAVAAVCLEMAWAKDVNVRASVAPWEKTPGPNGPEKPGESPFLHCQNFAFNGVIIDG